MGNPLKLAITTIGDLLLKSMFSRDADGKPISDINLVIPNYQRPYKWTGKNVIQLLDDIIEAKNQNKETYRVGTLILHKNEKESIYNIVDGQQRTITFSLLLKVLGADPIPFLEQPLVDNPYNTRNIPNIFITLERRFANIEDGIERNDMLDYVFNNF